MPRKIVICFDGTSNEFGKTDTNVVRLVKVLNRDQSAQRLYYDPGVGTLPEPGFVTSIGKKLSDIMGLAFGAGLLWKVGEAYSYLMETWEPGDQVYIFGFSRGAYSARVLAALLHGFGLLPSGNQNLLPYLLRLFKRVRDEEKDRDDKSERWFNLSDSFRWTFARQVVANDQQRRFPVHFLGVWDTVSSVGWIWNPASFPYTATNPGILVARHAVSIDEKRFFFRQNLLKAAQGQNFKQMWFAGSHCDVGGGYPEIEETNGEPAEKPSATTRYAGTWRCAFEWMVDEAKENGLLIDADRLATVLTRDPECDSPWTEAIHPAIVLEWWIGEFVPKPVWDSTTQSTKIRCGFGGSRTILDGAQIHPSALRRIRDTSYKPKNLSDAFQDRVKKLPEIQGALSYQASDLSP